MIGYIQAAPKRSLGFFVEFSAAAVLLLGSLGTIAWRLMHG